MKTGLRLSMGGLIGICLLIVLMLIGLVILLLQPYQARSSVNEIELGVIIVLGVVLLMTMLFVMAAGYSQIGLTDNRQSLGLPEGSIRALIALMLIMLFMLTSIYLFRVVGQGFGVYSINGVTKDQVIALGDRVVSVQPSASIAGSLDIIVRSDVSNDGVKLAQQLLTTVGTLVVAVAGFYFGTSAVGAARGAVPASPAIRDIQPDQAKQGDVVHAVVRGRDFRSPTVVRLIRGSEVIAGYNVLSNDSEIRCDFTVDKAPDGKWALYVENQDGTSDQLSDAFTVIPSSSP